MDVIIFIIMLQRYIFYTTFPSEVMVEIYIY